MTEQIRQNNVERFSGFGELYDRNRPKAPEEIVNILTMYLGRHPEVVADVGCGTGLSSFVWLEHADRIVGVEPNDDMRGVAVDHWNERNAPANLEFVKGLSYELPFETSTVDIITCSQSFHWMDPQPTLREFARVLRPGGFFAAYDCDWPPVSLPELEQSYERLTALAETRAGELAGAEKQAHKWPKDDHLRQIRESQLFDFSREIVYHHWESCDADRYANLAFSQGGLQTALKLGASELITAAEQFRQQVTEAFGGETREILFCYRMRLGRKKGQDR
ncbi:class I SAM-dependent methyltransferase [Paenibacillus macerans]|uniref:class I SAM-dependent methyltransferase n=1 Tax=Paenibacillus macerans TaxID=44252 RepID=UPI003D31974F